MEAFTIAAYALCGAMTAVIGDLLLATGHPVLSGVLFGLTACAGIFAVQTTYEM